MKHSVLPGSHFTARDHDSVRNALILDDNNENRIVVVRLDGIFMEGLEGTAVSQ